MAAKKPNEQTQSLCCSPFALQLGDLILHNYILQAGGPSKHINHTLVHYRVYSEAQKSQETPVHYKMYSESQNSI